MPCDAITIPQISLYPWKEGYHAPAPGYAHPAPHPAPHVVTPSPVHHAVYKPEPVYSLHHQPTPAPYSPAPAPYSYTPAPYSPAPSPYNKITPFVHHTPVHRFSGKK